MTGMSRDLGPFPRTELRTGSGVLQCGISPALSGGGIFAALGLDQLLLWRFLDFAPGWLYVAGAAGTLAAAGMAWRMAGRIAMPRLARRELVVCFAVALLLYLLGGEGRLFYANTDWQVRDAVLGDLIGNRWPFFYPGALVLRAPLGMYLAPALAGKAFGPAAADWALLLQNAGLLAIVFALAALLLPTSRTRLAALLVFVAFSGLDIVGQLLIDWTTGARLPDHLEAWAIVQYSSHITQAFWVPQHALAGWIAAALFLLWKDARLPLGVFLGAVPLLALWSPLAMLGALPFAALAGGHALAGRTIRPADVVLPMLTTLLAVPGLLYLAAGSDGVGIHLVALPVGRWLLFELVETAPFLAAVAVLGSRDGVASATLLTVTACLLFMPFVQVGDSVDFTMRASIPALAILSLLVADALRSVTPGCTRERRVWRALLILSLAVGSVTGLFEIRRSLAYRPSPRTHCSLLGVWDDYYGGVRAATYLAPLASFAAPIRPVAPASVAAAQPAHCWSRPWATPRWP